MSRVLYNEGRVVGFSAYEQYVKQALAEDPDAEVASERAWLASSLAMGASLLLKVKPTSDLVIDVPLPDDTLLVACNNVLGAFFLANPDDFSDSQTDNYGWVKQVGSYGDLIKNTSSTPRTTATTYDYDSDSMDDDMVLRLMNYIKIQDGLVLQPGEWKTRSASDNPVKIMTYPDFTGTPFVRLRFVSEITKSFMLLITGFTDKWVVLGETGLDGGAADTPNPQNGDFLGPEVFPWASKITFSVPSSAVYQLQGRIKSGSENVRVDYDTDTLETTISVDNEIISAEVSEKYLIITQENDGAKTTIEIDGGKLVQDSVEAGTGITLELHDDKLNIRTNLSSENGSGIDIGKSTTTEQPQTIATNLAQGNGITITDDTSSTKKTIATNIQAGQGIGVSTDSSTGAVIITNTDAYPDRTRLTSDGRFQVFNNVSTAIYSGDKSMNYWLVWHGHFCAQSISRGSAKPSVPLYTESDVTPRGSVIVYVSPTYRTNASGESIMTAVNIQLGCSWTSYKDLGGNDQGAYLACYGSMTEQPSSTSSYETKSGYYFSFRHATPVYNFNEETGEEEGVPESRILSIIFPPNSTYAKLSDTSVSIRYTETSNDGLWGVMSYYNNAWRSHPDWGANWPVRTRLQVDTNLTTEYRVYTLSGVEIHDGYNNQYYYYPYNDYDDAPLYWYGGFDIAGVAIDITF